jgi:hypothetical protein
MLHDIETGTGTGIRIRTGTEIGTDRRDRGRDTEGETRERHRIVSSIMAGGISTGHKSARRYDDNLDMIRTRNETGTERIACRRGRESRPIDETHFLLFPCPTLRMP